MSNNFHVHVPHKYMSKSKDFQLPEMSVQNAMAGAKEGRLVTIV